MKQNHRKMWRSVVSMVLALTLVFGMTPAAFAATGTTAQSDDAEFHYVSLGASPTNGYGMRGYLEDEVYQDPTTFDKNTSNVYGYQRAPETAYPSLVANALETETGKEVTLDQLAMSSMRAEEVRVLLDDTYDGDAYTEWRFTAGHNWFERAGGLDKLRAEYQSAVADADLITMEVGVNNFGVYTINQLTSGGTMFDTDLSDVFTAEQLEQYNSAKETIGGLVAGYLGYSGTDTIDLLVDTLTYAYMGYKVNFDASIAKIRELNPDAQIVVLSIPNMLYGVEANVPGFEGTLPLGDLYGKIINMANLYAAEQSPYSDEYLYARTEEHGDTETFLDEILEYDGNPESLSINMKDCFDIYDDDLKVQSRVKALIGDDEETLNTALNTAYDIVATIMQEGAKQNVIDLGCVMSGDLADAEDAALKYIEDSFVEGLTAVKNEQDYDFQFDQSLMEDPTMATVFCMGVRSSIGNSFFAHPNEAGHANVKDAIMEALDGDTTGRDSIVNGFDSVMNDLYGVLLEYGSDMFDSKSNVVSSLKKAVNKLDSYTKAEYTTYKNDVAPAYSGIDTELQAVTDQLSALRKDVKAAKSAVSTLSDAVNNPGEDAVAALEAVNTAAEAVNASVDALKADAETVDAAVKAAAKAAKAQGADTAALRAVAADLEKYVLIAESTISNMREDVQTATYTVDEDSYIVAAGDVSTGSSRTAYGYKLISALNEATGLNLTTRSNYVNIGESGMRADDLLYVLDETYEPDAYGKATYGSKIASLRADTLEEIQDADMILAGFCNNTIMEFALDQAVTAYSGGTIAEMDWTRYVGEEGAAQVAEIMAGMEASLIEQGMTDFAPAAMAAVESYLYGYVGFLCNYPKAVDKIHELNPDAQVILVGQYNPFVDSVITMNGSEIPLGEYTDLLIKLTNQHYKSYAIMTGNAVYVDAPDVELTQTLGTIDMDNVSLSTLSGLLTKIGKLTANGNGHEYIKTQIMDKLTLVDQETADAMAAMDALYELLAVQKSDLDDAKAAIAAARAAYDALSDEQKAGVDASILEFFEEDIVETEQTIIEEEKQAAAEGVAKKATSKVTAAMSGTSLKASWNAVADASGYVVKLYRNGKLQATVTTSATTYTWTNMLRGCQYKVTVQPKATYGGKTYNGIVKSSANVNYALAKASISVKKKSSKVTITSKDQNSTGFQIYISKDKKFKKNVKKITANTKMKGLSKTLKVKSKYFKSGTNYVKVRAYTKVDGKTVYGKWSTVKTVKR